MSKHTAGPWRIEGPYSRKGLADQPRVYYWAIEAGADVSGTRVADVYESPKGRADRENANARLIAAAPDLLKAGEMLERAGSLTCSCPDDTWFTCGGCLMRRAIQKATGENDV